MKRWKKGLALFAIFLFGISAVFINRTEVKADVYWPEGPEISTECAIVMEASTGTVLYAKNEHVESYPASITKIMTALLAIEKGDLDDVVEFSEGAVYNTEGSSILRDVGEHLLLKDCLYALMLASANDSAYAIAEHVGGDFDTFVSMMNKKAKKLGCQNTHFANPHGLQDENHYTSVYDMALIAREAWKNPTFRMFAGTKVYNLPQTEKHPEELTMQNHHQMLYPYMTRAYLYDDCLGGKTGYTTTAGSTLVTYAQRNGMTLICVVMRCTNPAHYIDTTALLDYYFDNFKMVNVSDAEESESMQEKKGRFNTNEDYVQIDKNAEIPLPASASFKDLTKEIRTDDAQGDMVGTIEYYYGDRKVGTAKIGLTGAETRIYPFDNLQETSGEAVSDSGSLVVSNSVFGFSAGNSWFLLKLVVLIAAAVIIIMIIVIVRKKRKKPELLEIKDNYRRKNKRHRK